MSAGNRYLKHKGLRFAFLAVGIGVFSYAIIQFDPRRIVAYLALLGFGMLLPIAISGISYIFNCLAWEQFLEARHLHISLSQLFRIKVSGEAVNTATPVSWVGGDPVRIALMGRFFSTNAGAASVILDRTTHSLSTTLMMAGAALLAFFVLPLSTTLRWGLSGALLALFILLGTIVYHQHRGLLRGLLYLADSIRIGRFVSPGAREKIEQIDRAVQDIYRTNRLGFYRALFYHSLGRFLGVIEIFAIAHLLHTDLSLLNSYFLTMLSAMINLVFVFIPGSMGVMEGAYGGLLHLVALDPAAGVAIQLTRRMRSFVWIVIGFTFIAFARYRTKREKAPAIVEVSQ